MERAPSLTLPQRERELVPSSSAVSPSPAGGGVGVGVGEGVGVRPVRHTSLPEVMLVRARTLRKNATDAENLLWQLLRRNQLLGHGFRRQHPLGSYILDFYCHQVKLAIELDGGQHAEDTQHKHDDRRSAWLRKQGVTVLRFWNNDVLQNTEGVLQVIYDWLESHPLPNPPPLGEGTGVAASIVPLSSLKVADAAIAPLPTGEGLGRGCMNRSSASESQPATYEQIHKALLTGLLGNIGMKSAEDMHYLGAREIKFFVVPNSALAKKGAKWVVAAEIVETTRLYARCVARIEPEWLEEIGAHLIKRHYYDPHWEKKAAQVAAWERSTLYGLIVNPKKRVHYGPMNVAESRAIFIRQALVAGEFDTTAPFFAHNRKLVRDIEALEHKARRPDVLVDEELIFAFYDSRIPPHIHNGAAFEAWRKEAERKEPRLLYLQRDDLMRHEAAGITTEQFPPQLVMNNVSYALGYHFAPGQKDDGVTLTVPQALINQVSAARCEYLAPGLLAEKVTQLLKTLPQKLRRHLVPVPEFAAAFCREVRPSDTPLLQALARYIREQKQLETPLDAFRLEQLPPHLAMNFRVVDEHGRQLGMSRNFAQLRGEWAPKFSPSPSPTPPPEGEGLTVAFDSVRSLSPRGRVREGDASNPARHTSWDFGDFAETSQVQRAGQNITVFNALVDEGNAISLQAFDTREEAQNAHRKGLARLFMLALKEQVKFLEKNLPDVQAMAMQFMPFGSQQDLQRQILSVTFDRCCLMEPWPGNEKEFAARCKEAKNRLALVAQEIARLAGSILAEYQLVQKTLQAAKTRPQDGTVGKKSAGVAASRLLPQTAGFASNVSNAHSQACQDIRAQCEWLLHREFIAQIPYERLQHVPRYLKAINVRMEKLRANPARDAQQLAQLLPLQQQWQRRQQGQQGERDPRLADFGWLLQELRVSLFAQELKTPVIVSVKRLQKMWEGM
ncbi:MAG: DUF3418 domain-containing protein [Nitrosomonadales bacterium]|nr:DUF3418 domain-containing protein [Nitrosomonadales bacterium]